MGFRVVVGTALAVLLLCGVGLAAPAAGGPSGERPARDAGGSEEELRVGAAELAELAAVPAESRALFAKVLGRLEGMRDEMEELKAGKARSDARIARLEESECECGGVDEGDMKKDQMEDMKAENDEKSGNSSYINGTTRHRKQAGAPACGPASWAARTAVVMDACCPATPGGHRRAQDTTCPLPDTCPSAACAAVFVAYHDDCALELQGHSAELPLPQFAGFYASCQELASGAGQMLLQPVAVQMFRVLVNTEGAARAGSMFPGGGDGGDGGGGYGQPLDPLQPVTPVPPSPPPDATAGSGEATGVTQYHAVCTSADVASCVPACNAEHHGYELLATIDGTDTKFSCNLAHGLYSWMGAASEGGYLGADSASFFSAVVSGAAGTYIVTLTADAGIGTDLTIQPGQDVRISGDLGLAAAAPSWGGGSFTVRQDGSLSLTSLALAGSLTVQDGGMATVSGGIIDGHITILRDATTELRQVFWSGQTMSGSLNAAGAHGLPFDRQCFDAYTTLTDSWRATTSQSGNHCDSDGTYCASGSATGVGGRRWYRFAGPGGDDSHGNQFPTWHALWNTAAGVALRLGTA
jgi:hypothetical protein